MVDLSRLKKRQFWLDKNKDRLAEAINHYEGLIEEELCSFPQSARARAYVEGWRSDPCWDLVLPHSNLESTTKDTFGKATIDCAEQMLNDIQSYCEIIVSLKYAKKMVKEAEAVRTILGIIKGVL